jgi:hypothetical protein
MRSASTHRPVRRLAGWPPAWLRCAGRSKFAHRIAAASKAATAFLTALGRYASPSDRRLITSTDHLLHRFQARVSALVKPEAAKLARVLGLQST